MNRILVSPKAVAVAQQLHEAKLKTNAWPQSVTAEEMAKATGLAYDTIYRALVELQSLRALTVGGNGAVRAVIVHGSHWLWTALKQDTITPGVAVR